MHFVVLFFRRGRRRSRHRLGKHRKIFLCVFLLLNYTGRLQPAKITRRTQQRQSLSFSSLSALVKLTAASIIHLEMQQLKKFSHPECALQKWRRLLNVLRSFAQIFHFNRFSHWKFLEISKIMIEFLLKLTVALNIRKSTVINRGFNL